jgi:hypothetical protein
MFSVLNLQCYCACRQHLHCPFVRTARTVLPFQRVCSRADVFSSKQDRLLKTESPIANQTGPFLCSIRLVRPTTGRFLPPSASKFCKWMPMNVKSLTSQSPTLAPSDEGGNFKVIFPPGYWQKSQSKRTILKIKRDQRVRKGTSTRRCNRTFRETRTERSYRKRATTFRV